MHRNILEVRGVGTARPFHVKGTSRCQRWCALLFRSITSIMNTKFGYVCGFAEIRHDEKAAIDGAREMPRDFRRGSVQ